MADDCQNVPPTQCPDQPENVTDKIGDRERREITVVVAIPASRSTIAPLVRRHHMIARICQGQHDVSPAVGQFRKPVQQQNQGTVGFFEPDLHQVH